MDSYLLFFIAGAAGLVLMAALGVAGGHGTRAPQGARGHSSTHAASHHAATHLASAGRGNASARSGSAARGNAGPRSGSAARGTLRGGRTHNGARGDLKAALSNWLSPRVLFTLALGAGATGLLLAPFVQLEMLRAALALGGALGLEKLAVAPLWDLLSRFGSTPARTLESAVMEEATALTAFDSQGCGLVSITLDGHEMRALARLKIPAEPAAPRVRAGDLLLVESVDAARGQCVVSRPGSGS